MGVLHLPCQLVEDQNHSSLILGRYISAPFSVAALMAKCFAIRMQDDGVASAIADDRVVASVQNKLPALVCS